MKKCYFIISLLTYLFCGSLQAQTVADSSATVPPEDEIFLYMDELAYFNNGNFEKYIEKNYHFTEKIISKGKPGYLIVEFVVEKDGTITNVEIMPGKGLTKEQDAEAVRVIRSTTGMWIPGKINSKPVRTMFKQKFTFAPENFE